MDLFKLVGSIFINNSSANDQIDETTAKAETLSGTISDGFKTAGDKMTSAGKKMLPVSLAVGGALVGATKAGSDFTDGMAKMSTLFDTSKVSVEDLSNQFLDLSSKSGISATELAEAGYQALSAGVDVNDSVKFVETASNLAKAGFTSTSTAVDVLTTAMNAYGAEAGTAEEISNKLVRTQNLGKTTVDELASSMGKIIPTASSMHVNIDNLTSGYVALTKQGIATAEATTYMNSMLNELGDSGTVLGGVLQEKTGKSFQELSEEGYSLADILQITKDYADENGIAYNELWGSAEAGKAGLAILNGGVEEFNGTVETMSSDVNDVGDALEKLDTPSTQAKKALNQVKNSAIELGTSALSALAPILEKICDVVERVTTWFNGLSPTAQKIIVVILGIIAVAGPLLIFLGSVLGAIGNLITVIPMIVSALQFLIPMAGPLLGAFGPFILIIGAIIGAIIAVVAIVRHWGEITEWFKGVWENFTAVLKAVWDQTSEYLMQAWEAIKNFFLGLWEGIKTVALVVWEGIKYAIVTPIQVTWNVIQTVWNAIKTFLQNAWTVIQNIATTVWNTIKTVIINPIQNAWTTLTNIVNNIRNTISNVFENIRNIASNVWEGIKNAITSPIETARNIISGILDGIRNLFPLSIGNIFSNLKLPHFSWDWWDIGGLVKIPHITVDWYKKAMGEPYMFTNPTLFGMNPSSGSMKGAGEAGNEIMYGHQNLMNDIGNVVSSQNNPLIDRIDAILSLLETMFPELVKARTGNVYIGNKKALVGEIIYDIDNGLGLLDKKRNRGM